MSKKNNNKLIFTGAGAGGVTIIILLVFSGSLPSGVNNFGNVSTLSFVEDHRSLNCEAFNKLGVTKNGQFSIVASGREGFNPLLDSNLLSVTQGGVPIESFHVQLVLICDGDLMKDSSAVTVSGTNNLLLCGDPSNAGTTCLLSDERSFQSLNGRAVSTTQFNSFPLGTFALPEDQETVIYQGNIRVDDIERIFPEGVGTIVFKSNMLPQLTLTFNHPTKGIFTATYDALAINDIVYAQYNGLANNAPPPPDTDGDGFIDTADGCINQPETINGFQDEDGCPDTIPVDTDGDGVVDSIDDCDTEPETVNGFQDSDGCPDVVPDEPMDDVTQTDEMFMDTDLDGIVDSADLCPFTSEGIDVDSDGCTLPENLDVTMNVNEDPVVEDPILESPDDDIGERSITELPPPLVASTPDVQTQQQPQLVTTTTGSASPEGEITTNDIIIILIVGGVIGGVILGVLSKRK